MRFNKVFGTAAAILLIISCFLPWVVVVSKAITISGMDANGTNYGKPGYLNLILAIIFLIFSFIPRVWAKRANLLIVALNLGWAIRNYFMLSACQAGECPEKKIGLYLQLVASIIILIAALFPDMKLPEEKNNLPVS